MTSQCYLGATITTAWRCLITIAAHVVTTQCTQPLLGLQIQQAPSAPVVLNIQIWQVCSRIDTRCHVVWLGYAVPLLRHSSRFSSAVFYSTNNFLHFAMSLLSFKSGPSPIRDVVPSAEFVLTSTLPRIITGIIVLSISLSFITLAALRATSIYNQQVLRFFNTKAPSRLPA